MKTWEQLNAEFTQERMKINPDEKKLEEIYLQMLKVCDNNNNLYSPYDSYIKYSKVILLAFVLILLSLAIFT